MCMHKMEDKICHSPAERANEGGKERKEVKRTDPLTADSLFGCYHSNTPP